MEEIAKSHPRKTVAVTGGTSIFVIVFLMLLIYVVFDGKLPSITLPISFPTNTVTPPTNTNTTPTSYVVPNSYPISFPVSYP